MAIYSMTGFGRSEVSSEQGWKITVELSSVNRKQLDCNVSMPRELASCESKVQACVGSQIKRGYLKGLVSVESVADALSGGVNIAAVKLQVDALRRVARELNLEDDLTLSSLLCVPDFFKSSGVELNSVEIWPDLEKALLLALKNLKAMRRKEGDALEVDLLERFDALRRIMEQIAGLAPEVPLQYKKTLEQRIENLLAKSAGMDTDIIAREVAVYADRCDISEELTRLESHFTQTKETFKKGGLCGRTLDFICQEMFREINTTGAKAGDAKISKLVINFKAGLEAAREQVQNIE